MRGKAGVEGAYHLDHIISVKYGFIQNIDPKFIGSIENLWFVPWKINLQKSDSIDKFWNIEQYYPVGQYGESILLKMKKIMKYSWGLKLEEPPLPKLKRIENAN